MKTGKITKLGLFTAFAVILGYVEALIPFTPGIPGMKLGIANLAVVLVLYRYGWREALLVSGLRVAIIGLLFGNLFSTLFSLAGAVFSLGVMAAAKKGKWFGIPGVSVAGGVSHNMAQIAVASVLVENVQIMAWLPFLMICGVVTGFLIGICVVEVNRRIPIFDSKKREKEE
ncbi:MAG: Gx transporter family protein [Fusicatenibacter sp.]|nr:Gx transporter family protein [Lachnospiraceae bacterium]MDY2937364.1 Gx transporter family protein [Fusicatenibacter sp.]